MTKIGKRLTIDKEALLLAVENTYQDSKFFAGLGVLEDCDFSKGIEQNRSVFITKDELRCEIMSYKGDIIDSIPEHPEYLVLSPKPYISARSIDENQIYHTEAPEGYYHAVCKYNPHFDVYIKIDKENMTISFMLGDRRKTLCLEISGEYTYKLMQTKLLCSSIDGLESFIKDDFWNPRFVVVGRKALNLYVCEYFKK